MRKFMDIISGVTPKTGKPVLNENEQTGMEYSIEPAQDGYKVYQIDTYPDHSVMAGQTRKRFCDSFPTEASALEHYPSGNVGFVDPHSALDHLPDADDLAGGMFPDDLPHDEVEEAFDEDAILEPHDDDALMADIDAAHEQAMRRYDDHVYDSGLD